MKVRLRFPGLLLLACAGLVAQQYPFLPVAGSPRNIEHILQDRQGRLWIGTLADVQYFDGARFFSLHEVGFPVTSVFSLAQDDEGGIVIGSEGGAYRYFEGRLEKLPPEVIAARVTVVAPGLLFVTGNRPGSSEVLLYRVRRARGAWQTEELTAWPFGEFETRDRSGAILTGCPGGWCEYYPQRIASWTPKQPAQPVLHHAPVPLKKVLRDASGCLWFRTLESAAYQCPGDSSPATLPALVAGRNVWAGIEETGDGSILFANASSLALGRPGAFQVATPENGLPSETISCAIQARDGTIWAGSIGGLYRFPHPFRLHYWKSRFGPFWSITRSGGRIFAGTSAGVANLENSGEWSVLPATRGLGTISSLLPEADGSLYAAVSGSTVIHLRMPGGAIDARMAGGQDVQPQFLARGADGSVWAAGAGFCRLVRKGGELIALAENPQGAVPSDSFVASDPSGAVWGCFSGGLIRRGPGAWQTIAREGMPAGLCRSLAFSGGDVWAGYNTAIAWVRAEAGASQVRRFTTSRDAGASNGWTFGTDTRAWLWRGSLDGMFAATGQQAQRGVWIGLGEPDGLTGVDVNHNSFFSDADGSVWWAADNSVFQFTPPANLLDPPGAAGVFVSAFSVAGRNPKPADAAGAFSFRQPLTVHLASLRYGERNSIRIRYRVRPEQTNWREAWSLDLDLGPLSWGSHTLEYQSRFTTGQWSPPSSRQLTVTPPWWFSLPALLGFAGIGSAGAAGGVAWRNKRKRRTRNRLPDLDAWRAAVLAPESQLEGSTLDRRFRVLQAIARGGFATVFRGQDLRTKRPCAIKVFRQETLDEEWITHRFQQEVSALEQIRHPSVVSIYGHGLAAGRAPYLAMELIAGGTLRDLLTIGPPPLCRTASLLRQAGEALGQIHARGIFHRDLKPENLMLRDDAPRGEELVLIDFSIAILKEPDQTVHGLSRAAGTIYYMAPEQAVGFATAASDIYSLAKIALEMLTGRRLSVLLPDAGMDLPEKVRNLVRAMPLRLTEESVGVLGSALEFDPSRRPQAAREFVDPIARDLLAASSDRAASPYPSPKDGESAADSFR